MLTASLDDFSIFGADLGAQMAQGDGAETDLCVLLTDWCAGGAGATPGQLLSHQNVSVLDVIDLFGGLRRYWRNTTMDRRDDMALDQ